MNEFTFIFRNANDPDVQFSPEQMQSILTQWRDWMGSIAAQNKLASPGNRLGFDAKVLKPNDVITDGPYVEMKEMVSGYIIVKTDTIEEAAELAKGCPVLKVGGSVEVRSIIPMSM
ncbi:YciI family protein [uncultured Mucilaginibacter sp.]|uniref:YciI family protein n=1 Tax=uncultured Mucilaginibacter sp. TaxID=797541 RepID=UPI0025FFEA00|nr:YciI family protein [uncultured Mucilaginibacter sp.]